MERGGPAGGSAADTAGAGAAPAAAAPAASGEEEKDEEEEREGCAGLWELPVERSERRPQCGRCGRPQKVCLCPFLPVHPLKVSTCLYIIQHPAEESRVLRTVPLLAACLPPDKCKILIGRRFSEDRYPELATVCRNPNTLILYPGAEAANLEEITLIPFSPSVMIIIDGTWSQAKDIFYKNSLFRLPKQLLRQNGQHVSYCESYDDDFLVEGTSEMSTKTKEVVNMKSMKWTLRQLKLVLTLLIHFCGMIFANEEKHKTATKKLVFTWEKHMFIWVQLKTNISSQYVIRTQPTNTCLSTLECAAIALTIMEKNKSIQETILRPLQALCSFQLQHGAQIHHSKEHLLRNGLYDKPMPKNKRKLRRMELLVNNVKI